MFLLLIVMIPSSYVAKNNNYSIWKHHLNGRRQPILIEDISRISSWMTFDYINNLFNLPQTYLEQTLNIQDYRYPFLTVGQYAKRKKVPVDTLIENIKTSVREYLSSSTPK